ncbi:MAG: AAA family ATPase, partial [Bacteroidales bacterium]|nr:AAA family ATPase [Bacteroidales bacterium]
MTRQKTVYVCSNCGAESAKWIGRCPSCGEWNTYHEEIVAPSSSKTESFSTSSGKKKPELINNIKVSDRVRISTGINELDRVLGGGMVGGSLILLGGEPGIGKSTLALQMALSMKQGPV